MKIKIICVGKLKEKYLKEGIAEYQKRLGKFTKFEIIEVPDEKIPYQSNLAENNRILKKESHYILDKVDNRDYVIALAIEGKQLSSECLAKQIDKVTVGGISSITFIIGGSLGLDNSVKKRADLLLSFGLITLPHQLMRLVLIEQIYRVYMINQGSPYHK